MKTEQMENDLFAAKQGKEVMILYSDGKHDTVFVTNTKYRTP